MTLAELRAAALQEAGILASGESAEPEDDQLVATKYTGLYNTLRGENLVAWAVGAAIPEYADIPMTMMLAAVIAPAFGKSGQRLADLRQGYVAGERMLRRALAESLVAYPVKTEYF